jgi:hypothetical protein
LTLSPNKTLYIKAADMDVWERAEKAAELTRQSISQFVAQALREQIARVDTLVTDSSDITVEVGNSDGDRWEQVFRGRWIVEPDDNNRWASDNAGTAYGVAQTARNALVFYAYHVNDQYAPTLLVYPNLDEAAAQLNLSADVVALIAGRLGQRRVIRMDI